MNDSLYTSINALEAAQVSVNKLSQNLSNMNSVSYKKEVVGFSEISFSKEVNSQKTVSSIVTTDFSQGNVTATGNPFDVAIEGPGFMEVVSQDGDTYYTRKGTLQLDEQGYLSINGNYRISTGIQIPSDINSLVIAGNGDVVGSLGELGGVQIGKIELYSLNEQSLVKQSDGLYSLDSESDIQILDNDDSSFIAQGYLELSNVDMTSELMGMVLAQSMFQANAKVFQVSDEIIDDVNSMLKV